MDSFCLSVSCLLLLYCLVCSLQPCDIVSVYKCKWTGGSHFEGHLGKHSLDKTHIIWALTRENLSLVFVNNKGTDHPAHLHSLISAFVIRLLESIISKLATSKFLAGLCN